MKHYYVESNFGWFVVKAQTKRIAKSEGIAEWGRGTTVWVREATKSEVRSYVGWKGQVEEIR